jgi:hypothetical protein
MGVWGEGPFDNDRAGDLMARLMLPVTRVATQKSDASDYYLEARARRRSASSSRTAPTSSAAHPSPMSCER